MALTPGTRLGPYEITAQIGEGGMGEVYRATDTTLNRQVAVKVLPESLASDAERIARFEREAKTLASLNHPNIAQIYGFDKSSSVHALVMELVEGPTLADRIAQGVIPIDEALPIAKQIAEALEAAHEQGIIHRDLKPANVKLRPDGVVKVLDFGLAKALEPTGAMSPGMSQAPTITTPAMTQAGMILGTAAYMSPEQAKGKTVDKRSDVWAFGAVLYEMLSGKRAFDGEDMTDVLGAVVRLEPAWDVLPLDTPPLLLMFLKQCLKKDPKQRVPDIAAMRLALEGAFETTAAQGLGTVAVAQPVWRRALPFAATAAVVGIVVGLAVWALRPTDPRPVIRSTHVLPEGHLFPDPGRQVVANSLGGEHFVYTAIAGLYLRAMDTLEEGLIPGTEGAFTVVPFFSPDGQSVGYFDTGSQQMKRVGLTGGASIVIADSGLLYGASWGPDGTILYGQPDGIWQVSENGGEPEHVIATAPGEQAYGPQRLPGDDWVLFTLARAAGASRWDEVDIIAESLTSGERRVIRSGGSDARYVTTGHLVYARAEVLYAMPFDVGRLEATGNPVPVVQGVRRAVNPAANNGAAFYAFSTNGTLVYAFGNRVADASNALAWIDLAGQQETLDLPRGDYTHPRFSPDGQWLAFGRQEGVSAENVWVYEVSGATTMRRLTEGGSNRYPVWSGDGTYVAFQSDREGDRGIFWQRADGTGPVERLTMPEADTVHIPEAWSPTDGRLAFSAQVGNAVELWLWTVADRTAERFGDLQSTQLFNTVFSPDGQWMAYTQRGGVVAVYVQSVSAPETRFQLGPDEGVAHHPLWAPDGNRLFYFAGALPMAVDVRTQPTVGFGRPVSLAGLPFNVGPSISLNHDVAPDGSRFVATFPGGVDDDGSPRNQLILVQRWFEELRRLVPTD